MVLEIQPQREFVRIVDARHVSALSAWVDSDRLSVSVETRNLDQCVRPSLESSFVP